MQYLEQGNLGVKSIYEKESRKRYRSVSAIESRIMLCLDGFQSNIWIRPGFTDPGIKQHHTFLKIVMNGEYNDKIIMHI